MITLDAGAESRLQNSVAPWGNAQPHKDIPDTGVTRRYDFTITTGLKAPDGFSRRLILINGDYIGPTIQANWGDTIQVTVRNQLQDPSEGTTIHWHGQPQTLYPEMDGVPSVDQCPIPPGSSFTYTFRAESFGTGWYHAHVSAQYIDGLFGAMVIYGPRHVPYDIDLGPVLLQDYQHQQYRSFEKPLLSVPYSIPPTTSNLINGKNPFDCSKASPTDTCTSKGIEYSRFDLQRGKTHRLRIINAGGNMDQKFSIDGHDLMVIAQDYVPIVPYNTSVVTVGTGQRTDVLVVGKDRPADSYWMRADLQDGRLCSTPNTTQPHAKAIMHYEDVKTHTLPNTTAYSWAEDFCLNDPLSKQVPFYPLTPPSSPGATQEFSITVQENSTGHIFLAVNKVAFYADYNIPILGLAHDGNTSYPQQWSVYNFNSSSSVRAIWYNYFPNPHPMHLHGHDFWILAEGNGTWDGTITNPANPARRDTHILAPGGLDGSTPSYTVFEWKQDNPGVWPFHCHFILHNAVGLYVNILERPGDIKKNSRIPSVVKSTCDAWNRWSSSHVVDQDDSGT